MHPSRRRCFYLAVVFHFRKDDKIVPYHQGEWKLSDLVEVLSVEELGVDRANPQQMCEWTMSRSELHCPQYPPPPPPQQYFSKLFLIFL